MPIELQWSELVSMSAGRPISQGVCPPLLHGFMVLSLHCFIPHSFVALLLQCLNGWKVYVQAGAGGGRTNDEHQDHQGGSEAHRPHRQVIKPYVILTADGSILSAEIQFSFFFLKYTNCGRHVYPTLTDTIDWIYNLQYQHRSTENECFRFKRIEDIFEPFARIWLWEECSGNQMGPGKFQ